MSETPALNEALAAPLGDLIAAVGRGVAQAQGALDSQTLDTIKSMYGGGDAMLAALREIGYQPTWYRIPEVESEIVISMSVSGESRQEGAAASGGPLKLYAAPVDATYQNKYEFNIQAASRVKFKVVPVPPSSEAAQIKAVPDVQGRSLKEATEFLDRLGIRWQHASPQSASDESSISGQQPAAGEILPRDGVVILETS